MTFAKTTAGALCLLAISPWLASADELAPRLIAAVPSGASPAPPAEAAARGPVPTAHQVVLFAGRTVEFAVPHTWTVKQVPLPGEIRVLAAPGDLPAEPHRLERGLWIAYHRIDARPDTSLEAELHEWLPRAVGAAFLPSGAPQATRVGGFAGLKQNVEIAPATGAPADGNAIPRRASYVIVRTPWGVLEALGVMAMYAEDDVRSGLKMALTSLQFNPPSPLPPISAPNIADAQDALGSWKGRQGALHFLPDGRVRLDFDVVTTLTLDGERENSSRAAQKQVVPKQIAGAFTDRGDLLFITWDDGSKLNYRWKVQASELLLMDHTGNASRLTRLFDSPRPSPGQAAPPAGDLPIRLPQP